MDDVLVASKNFAGVFYELKLMLQWRKHVVITWASILKTHMQLIIKAISK